MISSSTPATYQRVFFPDSFFQYESSWAEKTRVIEEGGHYWKARISDNNCFSDGGLVLLRTSLVFFKIPTCLYNSTMHSARFLFLYYHSPVNLCMILLAILHQLVHIQGNNPHLCKCLSFYYFCWKEKKSSRKNTGVKSHLSIYQPPEGVYDWFLELMFVLPSFLEVLTCEQNMIGYWLWIMRLTALPLPGYHILRVWITRNVR